AGARLTTLAQALRKDGSAMTAAAKEGLEALMERHADRSEGTTLGRELEVVVEPERARYGAWYERFPRSTGRAGSHGTFRDVEQRLPYVSGMGFDVLYLPPIHPIGSTHRKGRNNSTRSTAADPGSPWAIGSAEGGHKAVNPALGTLDDFRRLVHVAAEHGLSVALDIAFQCSPDHPYVREHPEVSFLSEAFTRPKVMYRLAKVGFSQSYTYFAWRNTSWELMQYFSELTQPPVVDFFRPNLWPNTPDILTEYLQNGGRAAFATR